MLIFAILTAVFVCVCVKITGLLSSDSLVLGVCLGEICCLHIYYVSSPNMKTGISDRTETYVIVYHITRRHIREVLVVSTEQEIVSAKDAINARAQDFVVNEELLLLRMLETFAQFTRSRRATRSALCFQCVDASSLECARQAFPILSLSSPLPRARDQLVCGLLVCLMVHCAGRTN